MNTRTINEILDDSAGEEGLDWEEPEQMHKALREARAMLREFSTQAYPNPVRFASQELLKKWGEHE